MDNRALFDRYVSRKPQNWGYARSLTLNPQQMEALRTLPRVNIGPDVGTFDNVFDEVELDPAIPYRTVEFLVIRENEANELEYYYVNTEGYSYARYVGRIPDCYVIGLL